LAGRDSHPLEVADLHGVRWFGCTLYKQQEKIHRELRNK
jgi:hypothetical protein